MSSLCRSIQPGRILFTVLAIAVISGCTRSQVSTSASRATSTPRTTAAGTHGPSASIDPRTYANSPLPLDAYRESPAEDAAISEAATSVANRCLQRFGFSPTFQAYKALHPIDQFARLYSGVRDVATARRYGYHDPTGALYAPLPSPQPPMSTAENLVAYGTPDGSDNATAQPKQQVNGLTIPEGGCLYEGYREVGQISPPSGSTGGAPETFAELLAERVFGQTMADPRVIRVRAQWASCMHGQGYPVNDPSDVPPYVTAPTITAAEIREAVSDATCAQHVNLFNISLSVEIELEKVAIQQNLQQLVATRALINSEVRKAAAIVAANP